MAWVKVESSVSRNRKFVQAGPAASWLWLCGLAYCQEGLTDGFIPAEALEFLGVKAAPRLVAHLVSARLWDVVAGGWRVHDYLRHNKSASDVRRITEERRAAGAVGGLASGHARRIEATAEATTKQVASPPLKQPSKHPSKPALYSTESNRTAEAEASGELLDVAFRDFQAAYPEHRRKGGHLLETFYVDQCVKAGGPAVLLAALENHKASAQWSDPALVPGMGIWLSEERWRQTLPALEKASKTSFPTPVAEWKRIENERLAAKGKV